MKTKLLLISIFVLGLALLTATTVVAQDGGDNNTPLSGEAAEIAANMTCLNCEGQNLNVCTTSQCADWRSELQGLVEIGRSPSFIYRHFADTYPQAFSQLLVRGQFGDTYPPNVNPNDVYYIADEMYCDVCAGVALSYCTSGQCRAWREEISDMLSDGYSETAIRQSFADRYGEKIAAVPIDEEDRFLTFALPIGVAGIFGALIIYQFLGWQQKRNYALDVAREAGTATAFDRPVPDNVDPTLLQRVLIMVEENQK